MGFLDFIFNNKKSENKVSYKTNNFVQNLQTTDFKDEREARCPSCKNVLKKIPGAKTKCPSCGEYMYVRTGPDNIRKVVSQKGADNIDEQWRIINGTQEFYLQEQKRREDRTNLLRIKFNGKEPSSYDVSWSLFNEDLLEHMKNQDWGLYRNTKFNMAELLEKEGRIDGALNMYLAVCYLDLNGPNNRGGFDDPDILKDFPPFDPRDGNAFLAPGVISRIMKIIKKSGISIDDLSKRFFDYNTRFEKPMRLPVSVGEAWQIFKKEIDNTKK
ncbi:MAG: hypothetical protein RLY49_73 [Candidatus Parcubacteria bacterium]|jgi:predicted RNA-binding Zn-ribbon protein involved in translation (DUF1610 family)